MPERHGYPDLQIGKVCCLGDLYTQFMNLNSQMDNEGLDPAEVSACVNAGFVSAEVETIEQIIRAARIVRASGGPVLITGDTGTGKEITARALTTQCCGRQAPFVAENCGAIPQDLVGSTLFGVEEGAFTGAKKRSGAFVQAIGGGILLDEIAEMPLEDQVALLRVLDQKKVKPIGGVGEIDLDVVVFAATNKNVEQLVEQGSFREDLFQRLNKVHIHLKPLHLRIADLCLQLWYQIQKWNLSATTQITHVSSVVLYELVAHHWPGNVRELLTAFELGAGEVSSSMLLTMGRKCLAVVDRSPGPEGLMEPIFKIPIDEIPMRIKPLMDHWEARMPAGCPPPWKPDDRDLGAQLVSRRTTNAASADTPPPGVDWGSLSAKLAEISFPQRTLRDAMASVFADFAPKKNQLLAEYIREVLQRHPTTSVAAKAAGVDQSTIRNWRKKYCGETPQKAEKLR